IGIVQTIAGSEFLNPHGGSDIDELSHLVRMSPSGRLVFRPPSVFVSESRFGWFLILIIPLLLGTAGYLLLRTQRGRKLVFPALGLASVAAMVAGSRGTAVWSAMSIIVISLGMIWGAPRKVAEAYRLVKAIRRSFIFVILALGLAATLFSQTIGARW